MEITVLLPSEGSRLLTQELLPTAVTRARECGSSGTADQLRAAIARQAVRATIRPEPCRQRRRRSSLSVMTE